MKFEFKRIVSLRLEKGMNQREFAEAVDIDAVTICGYEKGNREIRSENLLKIADFFNVSVEYLLERTDSRQTIGSLNMAYLETENGCLLKGMFYDMLDKLSSKDREAIHHMVTAMLKR